MWIFDVSAMKRARYPQQIETVGRPLTKSLFSLELSHGRSFPIFDGVAHFRQKVVALVDTHDPG